MPEKPARDWKILLVDDDEDNLGVAEAYLMFLGADVHTAVDGLQGLAALADFHPTFILLDLAMPVMDGWQMFEKLKDDPETASIPVIALTAYAMPQDKQRAKAAGFDGYITKPFVLNTLFEDIKRCLASVKDHRAPDEAAINGDGQ